VAALEDLGYNVNYAAADPYNGWNTICVEAKCGSSSTSSSSTLTAMEAATTDGATEMKAVESGGNAGGFLQQQQCWLDIMPVLSATTISTSTTPTAVEQMGKQNALAYGKEYLLSRSVDNMMSQLELDGNKDFIYVADQAVFVTYLSDNGEVHRIRNREQRN